MEKDIYDKMVKRTVTYTFGLWLALFGSAATGLYFAYGDLTEINTQKAELVETLDEIEKTQKTGMTLKDFQSTGRTLIAGDKNLENIMSLMEDDFYKEHFENLGGTTFDSFIDEKIKKVEGEESSSEHDEMKKISSTVLPSYVKNNLDFEDDQDFSELKFVNYVERIMQTFNLEYDGEIGVSDILPLIVEEKSNKEEQKTDEELLANKIFYIPVTFSITGSKASIIDFIYFIENVGRVTTEDNTLDIIQDDFFKKSEDIYRSSDLILDGEVNTGGYNMYFNQMADIESITFDEYIYEKRDGDRRSDFIANVRKTPQGLEKYSADVSLRFFVKGISDYKIEKKYDEVVNNLLDYRKDIQVSQTNLASLKSGEKTPEVAIILKRLTSYSALMDTLDENLKKFKTLKSEEIYSDILTSIEIEKKLTSDLARVVNITKKEGASFEEEGEENNK